MSLILFLIFSSFKSLYAWFFRVDEIMKKSANSSLCNVLNSIATSPVQWMRYLNISELSSKFTFTLFLKVLLPDAWNYFVAWLSREHIKSKLNQNCCRDCFHLYANCLQCITIFLIAISFHTFSKIILDS